METPLIDLSPKLFFVVKECQSILSKYILPDSKMTDRECIAMLLTVLDNKELVKEMRLVDDCITK